MKKRLQVPRRRSHVGLSYKEQMQAVVRKYQDAGMPWPATTHDIAAWAIQKGLWAPPRASMIDQCAEELANAMREEYIRDAQGRTVRAKHCARREHRGKQITFWFDIRTANRADMLAAFQQRRQQVLGDCRQLRFDVDSYNDNRSVDNPIQIILAFELDLKEEQLGQLP